MWVGTTPHSTNATTSIVSCLLQTQGTKVNGHFLPLPILFPLPPSCPPSSSLSSSHLPQQRLFLIRHHPSLLRQPRVRPHHRHPPLVQPVENLLDYPHMQRLHHTRTTTVLITHASASASTSAAAQSFPLAQRGAPRSSHDASPQRRTGGSSGRRRTTTNEACGWVGGRVDG